MSTAPVADLRSLLARAQAIHDRLVANDGGRDSIRDQHASAGQRLRNSVIRPLTDALRRFDSLRVDAPPAGRSVHENSSVGSSLGEQFWQLATDATIASVQRDGPIEIAEATAALQELACEFAPAEGADGAPERVQRLKDLQSGVPLGIRVQADGPYLVSGLETLMTWLGERLPVRRTMALCRCGRSTMKP